MELMLQAPEQLREAPQASLSGRRHYEEAAGNATPDGPALCERPAATAPARNLPCSRCASPGSWMAMLVGLIWLAAAATTLWQMLLFPCCSPCSGCGASARHDKHPATSHSRSTLVHQPSAGQLGLPSPVELHSRPCGAAHPELCHQRYSCASSSPACPATNPLACITGQADDAEHPTMPGDPDGELPPPGPSSPRAPSSHRSDTSQASLDALEHPGGALELPEAGGGLDDLLPTPSTDGER